jgi:hypothetical protein
LEQIFCDVYNKEFLLEKMVRHGGNVIDPSTELSEIQSMIASPTLQPQVVHGSNHLNGTVVNA